jgi:PhnB protein
MATRLNPYLSFADTSRQAMERYQEVFGGLLRINTFGEYGDPSGPEAEKVMHAMLETESGFTLMASDTPAPMGSQAGGTMAISLSGDDADELRDWWTKLAEGGTVTMPLEKQVWGDEFGMLTDKFGVPWMVNIVAATA